jgi:hypothetical protein
VNTAEHDECSAVSRQTPNFKSTQCVGGVDADPNPIAALYVLRTDGFKSLIDDNGIPVLRRSSSGKHIQPPRCDYDNTEGYVTRVD